MRGLLRQQRKRPQRAAGRDQCVANGALRKAPAKPRGDSHILTALVGVSDRGRVDARAGLELPKLLACVLIEREELAGELAGEDEPANDVCFNFRSISALVPALAPSVV